MRFVYAVLLFAVGVSPALAQRAPVIVIPGRPDVPVLMNGMDVSWAVIEGEFGLSRPGVMMPTVIYRLVPGAIPHAVPAAYGTGYFPRSGIQPGYGRLEVQPSPDRLLPPPAPSYRKSWSSQSAPGPATEYAPFPAPPVDVSIWGRRNGRWGHRGAPSGPAQGSQGGQGGQGPAHGPGNAGNE